MKLKIALKILAISIALAMVASGIVIGAGSVNNASNVSLSSATIYVPDDYAKIQWAVDNASAGDTIIVRDGTYVENVDVTKSLTIRSTSGNPEDTVVLSANPYGDVFRVTADYVEISGFTVTGAKEEYYGISIVGSSNNLTNNIASNNGYGIFLRGSSNIITNNTITSNNRNGIELFYTSDNTLTNNIITSNNWYGIELYRTSNNTLVNNRMSDNKYNFWVYGSELSHYIQNIDTSNKVNGKSIYYWINEQNQQVPSDAGYVGIVDSTNITMKDLILTNNGHGVLLAYSTDSRIENINTSNNSHGIYLWRSFNNTLSNNIALNNQYGIRLVVSSNNTLINNRMSDNKYNFWVYGSELSHYIQNIDTSNKVNGKPIYYWVDKQDQQIPNNAGYVGIVNCTNITVRNVTLTNNSQGVLLFHSTGSRIENITASNNYYGVYLFRSSSDTLNKNSVSYNVMGIDLVESSNNTLNKNSVSHNTIGINLGESSNNNNLISNNDLWDNTGGIVLWYSSDNTISNNNISDNTGGIDLWYSHNNIIYLNNVIDNSQNGYSSKDSTNIWNSPEEITYTYNGSTYTSYLGNYWDDYAGDDTNNDGIGDTPYSIDGDNDNYPLVEPWENYFKPTPVYGKGIWIWKRWKVENGDVSEIIEKVKSSNVNWVAIKCGDGRYFWPAGDKLTFTSKEVDQFHNAGIKVLGWQFVYGEYGAGAEGTGGSPLEEAEVANKILDIGGIDGLIIDAEGDYEGKADKAEEYLKAIRKEHPNSFIAYSTFGNPRSHKQFPYREFGKYCNAAMPQAYWIDWKTTPTGAINKMGEQWNELYSKWKDEGHDDAIKPIVPMGQSSDEIGTKFASGSEITEFCNAVCLKGYGGVSLFRYGTMTDETWNAYTKCFIPITITAYSPVDIVVTDPDGLTISKQLNEIPGATYTEVDINGDGDPDDKIIIPYRKIGNYLISVIPEPDALPTDTYTLEVSVEDTTITLAEHVQISDIPSEPYVIESTETGIRVPPVPVPVFNAIGLLALIAILTIVLALAVRRKMRF